MLDATDRAPEEAPRRPINNSRCTQETSEQKGEGRRIDAVLLPFHALLRRLPWVDMKLLTVVYSHGASIDFLLCFFFFFLGILACCEFLDMSQLYDS